MYLLKYFPTAAEASRKLDAKAEVSYFKKTRMPAIKVQMTELPTSLVLVMDHLEKHGTLPSAEVGAAAAAVPLAPASSPGINVDDL